MKSQLGFLITILLLIVISCKNQTDTKSIADKDVDSATEQLTIQIYDPTAHALVDSNATFEILAEGFYWSEGPLWIDELQSLIFSDVPANKIYRWNEKDSVSIFLESAGHTGEGNKSSDKGSNGLLLDAEQNLLVCQHGDRRIARLKSDLKKPQSLFVTVADRYQDKRFNSPNDLAMDAAGNIYFTDPPYGQSENKTAEIGMNGVFRISPDKKVTLLLDSLSWPNGIALSPDEQTLYINQSDLKHPVLYSYGITEEGSLENGRILFDFKTLAEKYTGLPDGLKIHKSGHIFATGPGGVHIISPQGKHLAAIFTGKATANCAFDSNQQYLYMTTSDKLIRVQLK